MLSELTVDKLAQIAHRFIKCTYSALIKIEEKTNIEIKKHVFGGFIFVSGIFVVNIENRNDKLRPPEKAGNIYNGGKTAF